MPFANRTEAGRLLAGRLRHLRGQDSVVLGLPRGGVPVAVEVAEALDAPLDVIVVRKLGVPYQTELGMGAIGEGGVRVINREVMRRGHISDDELAAVEGRERVELERRAQRFRGGRPCARIQGRTAIVVDDGVATGSTARAACQIARANGAARVVLAVPVAPHDWTDRLGQDADELVAVETPRLFMAIGEWYADFTQTTDDEVMACLARAAAHPMTRDDEVVVHAGPVRLAGHLALPEAAAGVVLFSHGSGSSRHSPRNRFVAEVLGRAGLGTLLFDLLTAEEERDRTNVFDTEMLARRLLGATRWVRAEPGARGLAVGYFGASTGAAAALWAAAEPGTEIAAVVSRGGRPDLAGRRLPDVAAPTLLIVGGHDDLVLDLNRQAQAELRCESRLEVVPGATHLFEEPGTLEAAAELARDWFTDHLTPAQQPMSGRR
ncbi:phosphoribosyltransferase family protein [Streptomyces sp. H10-C2]|uniref:phosphoribosyltransferase family protein n=1 Tax=unclassified Streptomyces TaxID=2593676 RepID=UPI0024B98D78|nr:MULTISPECIES: phosphoribosyltransferase family protein [unclassified Streptomyces]MDJ0346405.1 phosphoribosyltransferase family protein [Streptomyces sp. PH10-H1]MDJ0374168.1 phosphoribosyltransferase family protein [Streptomyces sp. H10-C2]